MRKTYLIPFVVAASLLLAACGGGDEPTVPAAEDATTTTMTTAEEAAATVTLRQSSLGDVLADAEGRTLYLFTKDSEGKSNCEGGCATTWPPLVAEGAPTAGSGVDASKLGTIARTDGAMQVTYGGVPLYRYAKDQAPGDVTGQGVGGVWFAVKADGSRVETTPTTAASGATATTARSASAAPTTTARPAQREATPTTAASPPPPPPAAAGSITIQNFSFSPPVLQISAGSGVTATNKDGAGHTWTADDGSWDSGTLAKDGAFTRTFAQSGSFNYHCAIHPSMKGVVNVS